MTALQDGIAQDDADYRASLDTAAHDKATDTFQQMAQPLAHPKDGQPAVAAPNPVSSWIQQLPSRISTSLIDSAVGAADGIHTAYRTAATLLKASRTVEDATPLGQLAPDHFARNVGVGVADAAAHTADFAKAFVEKSGAGLAAADDPDHASEVLGDAGNKDANPDANQRAGLNRDGTAPDPFDPIYNHARTAVMGVRDAMAVKDPTDIDGIEQQGAQFMIPFLGYSRAIGAIHGVSKVVASGAANMVTAGTAMDPNGGRFSDLVNLQRHTESAFGRFLDSAAPDGSALNTYITWAADHSDKSEFTGRLKNVADYGIAQGLLDVGASALKWGRLGLNYAMKNGVGSTGDLMMANQTGALGYHGSPKADIDKFDPAAIGKDESSAAFGHGLYVADDPAVAGPYAGVDGAMYKVHVPDEHVSNMIDWEKPIADQPNVVKKLADAPEQLQPQKGETGGEFVNRLGKTPETSGLLNGLGIRGIRYPASGKYSQGGSASRVSVLFDPNNAEIRGRIKAPQSSGIKSDGVIRNGKGG